MNCISEHAKTNLQPRLIGFLCADGAHVFYDVSNPARRKLPANFTGLPVACISQVQTSEVVKAFLSGADGVLIAGCDECHCRKDRHQLEKQFADIAQALASFGIDRSRLRVAWISAAAEEKFVRLVNEMMENLRLMPPLQRPARLHRHIEYCG